MSIRKLSVILFAVIGLLIGSKVGLHIWPLPNTTTDTAAFLSQAVAVTDNIQSELIIPELRVPAKPAKTTVPTSAADSLAMIESYLIPSANAETALNSSARSSSIFEDKSLSALRQLKERLEQRSKTLEQREQSVQQAEDQLKRRITELEQLEASIQQRLADESKIKNKKIKRLTAVYEGMKPERSAPVIARMELPIVVKIFLLMDEKKVGKILSFLPPEKAVIISQALTRRISSVK